MFNMKILLDALGKLISKVVDNTQGRIERLKNEKVRLEIEKSSIVVQDYNIFRRNRLVNIHKRLRAIDEILANNAHD